MLKLKVDKITKVTVDQNGYLVYWWRCEGVVLDDIETSLTDASKVNYGKPGKILKGQEFWCNITPVENKHPKIGVVEVKEVMLFDESGFACHTSKQINKTRILVRW